MPDTISYYEAAKMLYLNGEIHSTRPILFSLISGLPFLFGNISIQIYYWWNVFLNAIFYFLSLKMVYKLTNKIGVVLFILLIGVVSHVFLAVTEVMVMTMLMQEMFLHLNYPTEEKDYAKLLQVILHTRLLQD